MNKKSLHALEFHKIREQLYPFASSALGRKRIDQLQPSTSLEEVTRWQEETDEGATVIRLKGNVPLQGIHDIMPHAKRASIGGMLSAMELKEIASTIRTGRGLQKFIFE